MTADDLENLEAMALAQALVAKVNTAAEDNLEVYTAMCKVIVYLVVLYVKTNFIGCQ